MRNKERIPLELYVHIPFCVKKCEYCDFLSGPAGKEIQKAYVQALLKEIQGSVDDSDREIVSVFIGGGTPSLLDASDISEIMKMLKKKFVFSDQAEVTIEANPGTLTLQKLRIYRESGINRLSLGLQSVNNDELRMLGRIHDFQGFLESYELARKAGFDNINVDLIFAVPGQTGKGWEYNLRTVAELQPEHVSAYSLIIEEGTPFAEKDLDLPDEDTEYEMYEDTSRILQEYGYAQYEISNYARDGYICRHNSGYWKRTEYLGLGLGAASLMPWKGSRAVLRFHNTENMQEYLQWSGCPEKIRKNETLLSVKEQEEEFMFLGLRMTEGVSETGFYKRFDVPMEEVYGEVLEKYRSMGFMEKNKDLWRFTRQGIHVSNQILSDFLQD